MRCGVGNSLRQILEKRVVQSLEPLFDNNRMDLELRKLVRETFPEFCSSHSSVEMKPEDFVPPVSSTSVTRMDLMAETGLDFVPPPAVKAESETNDSNHVDDDATFSDEEDDLSMHKNVGRGRTEERIPASPPPSPKPDGSPPNAQSRDVATTVTNTDSGGSENEVKCGEKAPYELLSPEDREGFNKHLDFLEKDMRGKLQDFLLEKNVQTR